MAEVVSVRPKNSAASGKSGKAIQKCVFKDRPYKEFCHEELINHSIFEGKIYKEFLKKNFNWMMDILLKSRKVIVTERKMDILHQLFNDIVKYLCDLVSKCMIVKTTEENEFLESIKELDLRLKEPENLVYATLLALFFMMACVYYHKKRYVACLTYSRLAKRLLISRIFPKIDSLLTKWKIYFLYIHSLFTLHSALQFYDLKHENTCECIAEIDVIYELYGREIEKLTGEGNSQSATAESDIRHPLWMSSYENKPARETKISFLSEKEDSERFSKENVNLEQHKAYGAERPRQKAKNSKLARSLDGLEISERNKYSLGDKDSSVYVDSSDDEEEKDFTRRCCSNTQKELFDVDKIVLDYQNWNIVDKDCKLLGRHAWMVVSISRRLLSHLVKSGFHQPKGEKENLMRIAKALLDCWMNYPGESSNDMAHTMILRETINAHSLLLGSFDISTKSKYRKYFKEHPNDDFCNEEDPACQQIKFSRNYSELVERNSMKDSLSSEYVETKQEEKSDPLEELERLSKSKSPNKFKMLDLIIQVHHKSICAPKEDEDFRNKVNGLFENLLKQNTEVMKVLVIYTIDFCLEHTEKFDKTVEGSRDFVEDQYDKILNTIVKLSDLLRIYGQIQNRPTNSKSRRKNSKSKGSSSKTPPTVAVQWNSPLVLTNEISPDITNRDTRSSKFHSEYYADFETLKSLYCYKHSITDNLRSDLSILHGVPEEDVYQHLLPALSSLMKHRIQHAKKPRSSGSPLFNNNFVVKARDELKKAIRDDQLKYKSLDRDWKKLAECLEKVSRILIPVIQTSEKVEFY